MRLIFASKLWTMHLFRQNMNDKILICFGLIPNVRLKIGFVLRLCRFLKCEKNGCRFEH